MDFILDTSVTIAWCFEDEANEKTNSILEKLINHKAYVPSLWYLEVGNVLVMAERKERINYSKATEFLSLLGQLKIIVDPETSNRSLREIFHLARSEKLTTYDAAYLELAMRLGLPLATQDRDLEIVAKKVGVKLM